MATRYDPVDDYRRGKTSPANPTKRTSMLPKGPLSFGDEKRSVPAADNPATFRDYARGVVSGLIGSMSPAATKFGMIAGPKIADAAIDAAKRVGKGALYNLSPGLAVAVDAATADPSRIMASDNALKPKPEAAPQQQPVAPTAAAPVKPTIDYRQRDKMLADQITRQRYFESRPDLKMPAEWRPTESLVSERFANRDESRATGSERDRTVMEREYKDSLRGATQDAALRALQPQPEDAVRRAQAEAMTREYADANSTMNTEREAQAIQNAALRRGTTPDAENTRFDTILKNLDSAKAFSGDKLSGSFWTSDPTAMAADVRDMDSLVSGIESDIAVSPTMAKARAKTWLNRLETMLGTSVKFEPSNTNPMESEATVASRTAAVNQLNEALMRLRRLAAG